PFDFVSCNEKLLLTETSGTRTEMRGQLNCKMRDFQENYLMTARDYAEFGAWQEAIGILRECRKNYPMLTYYEAYYRSKLGEDVSELLKKAERQPSDYCFPNKLEDIFVLRFAIRQGCAARAGYYLGNLFYDRLQWKEALTLWENSVRADAGFPTAFRNLALVYYNKCKEPQKAGEAMEKAFSLNPSDVRIFLELDQLHKKLGWTFEQRLADFEAHRELISGRDDLYIEYITLINMCGEHEKAYECIMGRKFHPWEGGEGKITTQYTIALLEMAKKALGEKVFEKAEKLLREALVYPENLGEGKLEGTKDNHLYYHLGLALEAQGRVEEAEECYRKATVGTDEPAGAMYYNDQPADMILYQGLAYQKLGKVKEARSRFYRLI
ncbi:MAG: tetratricopeptide repeat protein, partial [Acetatifactor sp.]|nr:tetratricopeptide repeat protein [Acetatifactor sp.]